MIVTITGAAGFLGSHLVERALAEGHHVLALDNLSTGVEANLEQLRDSPRLRFVVADLAAETPPLVEIVRREFGTCDLFLHFASPASPADYARLPLEALAVNSRGTAHVCEAAIALGARVVFASTSEVYGEPLEHPQRESYFGNVNPIGERACYDEAKRFGEALVSTYVRSRGLDARIARIFNTYGPRQRLGDGRVIPTLLVQALRGDALTISGDGSQTRSFCYVDDLIEGIFRLAEAVAARGRVVNLGNPSETTIAALAQRIARLAGVALRTRFLPRPSDDPSRRCPDIGLARTLLGWEPLIDLEAGLGRTLDFARRYVRLG